MLKCNTYHFICKYILRWKICHWGIEKWKWEWLSHVQLFVTPWQRVACQAPLSQYRSGWPFSSPRDLHNPGITPSSPALQVDSLPSEPPGKPKHGAPPLRAENPNHWTATEAPRGIRDNNVNYQNQAMERT